MGVLNTSIGNKQIQIRLKDSTLRIKPDSIN